VGEVAGGKGPGPDERPRNLPLDVQTENEAAQHSLYRTVQWLSGAKSAADVRATVLLVSGCQDNQLSYDGPRNGRFTTELLATWQDGAFRGDYGAFHRSILTRMPPDQSPNYSVVGAPCAEFEAQRPFTVEAPDDDVPDSPPSAERPTLRRGDRGPDVTELQERLRAHGYDVVVDGYFGPQVGSMVRAFQQAHGLAADGVVGPLTWEALERVPTHGDTSDPGPTDPGSVDPEPSEPDSSDPEPTDPEPVVPTLRQGDRGEDVRRLQMLLRDHGYAIVADGAFGPLTTSIVRQFQSACGLTADGIVGPDTWEALEAQEVALS
jgi:peptidoglycan hydrolase-like protein with peptidoglycan-binding domain